MTQLSGHLVPLDDPSTPLPTRLRMSVNRLARRLRQQAFGITASQISALAALHAHGPVPLGELASIEKIAPPSMSRIVARLEEAGLVERIPGAGDKRVTIVSVTDAGRALLDEARSRRDLYLAGGLARMTKEEVATLEAAVPLLVRLAAEEDPQSP